MRFPDFQRCLPSTVIDYEAATGSQCDEGIAAAFFNTNNRDN